MSFFGVVLIVHIALALALFVPSLLLPFALRSGRGRHRDRTIPAERRGRLVRGSLWLQERGSPVVAAGVALTGAALVAILGVRLLEQPWLLLALAVYAANLVLAFFVQRPALRRLLGSRADADDTERARWHDRARRLRYVSYVMAAAVGVIAFLMTSKPSF